MFGKLKKYYKTLRRFFLNFINDAIDFFKLISGNKQLKSICTTFDCNTVVLVCDKFTPRVNKIIYGISSLGKYKIALIYREKNIFNKIENSLINDVIFVGSSFKAVWILKRINPFIIHIFSNWDFDIAYSIIKNRHKINSKIVFDDYDVFAGMLNVNLSETKLPGQLAKEKYCLENADGLCCRSIETQFAKRNYAYIYKGKRIFFPEYLWEETVKRKGEEKIDNSVVYIGNFNNSVINLAIRLKAINWSLVIYSPFNKSLSFEHGIDNLIIKKTLKPKELVSALTQYRIAIQFPGCILDERNNVNTPDKYIYAAAGKVFDYLEAGLKVLISDEEFQKWILKRYNAAIEIEKEYPLDDIIKKLSTFAIERNNVSDSANADVSQITIKKQIGRLEKFYLSL